MKRLLMILIAFGAIGWFASTAKTAEAGGCYSPYRGGHYGYYQPYPHRAYRYGHYNRYRPYPAYYPRHGHHHHHHGGVYYNGPRVSFGFGY
jgi:hypothetical protein